MKIKNFSRLKETLRDITPVINGVYKKLLEVMEIEDDEFKDKPIFIYSEQNVYPFEVLQCNGKYELNFESPILFYNDNASLRFNLNDDEPQFYLGDNFLPELRNDDEFSTILTSLFKRTFELYIEKFINYTREKTKTGNDEFINHILKEEYNIK